MPEAACGYPLSLLSCGSRAGDEPKKRSRPRRIVKYEAKAISNSSSSSPEERRLLSARHQLHPSPCRSYELKPSADFAVLHRSLSRCLQCHPLRKIGRWTASRPIIFREGHAAPEFDAHSFGWECTHEMPVFLECRCFGCSRPLGHGPGGPGGPDGPALVDLGAGFALPWFTKPLSAGRHASAVDAKFDHLRLNATHQPFAYEANNH
ncbi:uncharacterized protein BDR25DRAFT_315582 [Lindgomyces ingoldianus]|uniref:Uncharacterized protein n=1 Tax=Lindgomyces ingoldianus TaxID=673940 RepID=A0ACB6QSR5_9PLEO|nr:uncharacterized protein BDR25DRAFT_315582 [Lindgomyces ingoldianus]KAF2469117.1 hypothetical protein BDR25DRAFT_315582 [Lindgomyces ingoldianus]